jgi:hypothetical protein
MTARQALERAAAQVGSTEKVTFGLQYYGDQRAYFLLMLNGKHYAADSQNEPEILVDACHRPA